MDAWGSSFGRAWGNSFGYAVLVFKPISISIPGGTTSIERPILQLVDTFKVKTLKDTEAIRQRILEEDEELITIVIAMVQSGVFR